MTDERPPCTLLPPSAGPSTCYCTNRPGCLTAEDDEFRGNCPFGGCEDPDCDGSCWDSDDEPTGVTGSKAGVPDA